MIPNDSFAGKKTAGNHTPFWVDSTSPILYNKLKENLHADLVVIGGGIAGLSVAYCLSKVGKKVVVVEDGYIGSGETGRTTAHLASALDDRFYEIEKTFGEESSKLAAQSHAAAIDFIEQTCKIEQIQCEFKRLDGYLFLHPTDNKENIDKEYEAALRAGLSVQKVTGIPGLLTQPELPALKFENQAQFHPMLYIKGLCEAIVKNGGKIYTETRAGEISESGIVTTEGFKVLADAIVVATNAPFSSKFILPMKQFPYRSYAIGALVEKAKLPSALWWDTGDYSQGDDAPYHYVRTQPYNETHDLLISGGEDHPTGLADAEGKSEEDRYETLEAWTRKYFPIAEIKYRWSGQVMEPADLLGYIGKNPGSGDTNIYVVTGDSGHGMTHGTIAGILIRDLLTGQENPWEKLYNPSRPQILKKAFSWLKDWTQGFIEYLTTKPADTDPSKIEQLEPGEGTIVKIEGQQYGVYKDATNDLHLVNAKCTHMGCTVKWNNDEKSWDCPCHGSRFAFNGDVLNGPANVPLDYHKDSNKYNNIEI